MRTIECYTAPQETRITAKALRKRFPDFDPRNYSYFISRYNDEVESDWKAAWETFND